MTMENPATASWGLRISNTDFAKLKRGLSPRSMDDKWRIKFMTDQEVLDEETANKSGTATREPTIAEVEIMTEEELEADLALEETMRNKPPPTDEELRLDVGGNISIRGSWSSQKEPYRLAVKPNEDGTNSATIETITWEQNQMRHVSEEQAKIDIVLICRQNLECEFAGVPDHDPLLFSGFPLFWVECRLQERRDRESHEGMNGAGGQE